MGMGGHGLVWERGFHGRKRGDDATRAPQQHFQGTFGDFCWKSFMFMGKWRSLERAGGLLLFWGKAETLKDKVGAFGRQHLD